MNKFLKKLMTFGLSIGMFAGIGLDFAGCNGVEPVVPTPPVDVDGPNIDPNEDPDKKPDDEPVTPPVTEKKTLQQAEAEFDAFMQKLTTGKNFTYTLEKPLTKITAEIAGDKLKLNKNNVVTYLTEENGENFVTQLENDNAWHKDFAEDNMTIDYAISTVTDALEDVKWAAYDDSANLLTGEVSTTVAGLPITAQLEANFDQNDMSVKMKSGLTTTNMSVSKIGTTTVTLPENVIDETAQNNNIFTVDQNGEYVWNVKAIKDVLEPWLKNEGEGNQYGKDMFAVVRVNDNYKTKEVLYINASKDRISFGVIHDVNGQLSFGETYFNDPSLYENLSSKTSMTKKEFKDYLMKLDARRVRTSITDFDVEYTTHDQDYETAHKQEFETLTKNVFEKYIKTAVDKKNDIIMPNEIANYIVLFGMKTKAGDPVLGDHVYSRQWSQYYILKNKNSDEIILSKILVGSHINELGYLENVLQNQNEASWYVGAFEEMNNLSSENANLFEAKIDKLNKSKE